MCEGFSFWICALAINQHIPLDVQIVGSEGEKATENCIKSTRGIALLLDDELQPFGRVWCLYELLLAVRDDVPMDILTENGVPTRGTGYSSESSESMKKVRMGIEAISVEAAQSFVQADKDHILNLMKKDLPGGVTEMEMRIKER